MADYYPVLTRAVSTLDFNTGENRRAVYDRARTALVAQLRGYNPPLSEADITRERLALEEAIRRIEAEQRTLAPEMPRPAAAPMPAREEPEPGPEPAETPDEDGPDRIEPAIDDGVAEEAESPPRAAAPPRGRGGRTRGFDDHPELERRRLPVVAIVIALLAILGIAGAIGAYSAREQLAGLFGGGARTASTAPAEPTARPPAKITDRVGQSGPLPSEPARPAAPAAPPAQDMARAPAQTPAAPAQPPAVAPVAQRAILYEETGDQQGGTSVEGTVVWRTESVSAGQGQPLETALRGDVTIPARNLKVSIVIRRNTDTTLPASHTIELQFTLPPNFPNAGIANVPGLLMKTEEQTGGVALAGLSVRVTGGFFLIGLSNLESERNANEQLLRERMWIDIPILYDNGRRAVLTLEKGVPGEKAFNDAIAAWNAASSVSR